MNTTETKTKVMSAEDFVALVMNGTLPQLGDEEIVNVKGDVILPNTPKQDELHLENYLFDGDFVAKHISIKSLFFNHYLELGMGMGLLTNKSHITGCLNLEGSTIDTFIADNVGFGTILLKNTKIYILSMRDSIIGNINMGKCNFTGSFDISNTVAESAWFKESQFDAPEPKMSNLTIKGNLYMNEVLFKKYVYCEGMKWGKIFADRKVVDFIKYSRRGEICPFATF